MLIIVTNRHRVKWRLPMYKKPDELVINKSISLPRYVWDNLDKVSTTTGIKRSTLVLRELEVNYGRKSE